MSVSPEYLAADRSAVQLDVTIAVTVLTTIVYSLSVICRLFCVERNYLEAWVLPAFAYAFCVGLWSISYLSVTEGGAGRHLMYWVITKPTVVTTYLKLQTAAEFVYVAACLFPKLAILALYLRILTGRIVRICTWIVIGKWNKTIAGHCANVMANYRYVSLPHILTGIAIIIIPLFSLYHLQISNRRKVGIFLTFLMGSLGIVTAIIRFINFPTVDLASDPTWYAPNLFSFTISEASAYFICSCFPSIMPLLRDVYRWIRTRADSQYGPATGKSNISQMPLRDLKGGHTTSITAPKTLSRHDTDDDRAHFIRLDESVAVDFSPCYVGSAV